MSRAPDATEAAVAVILHQPSGASPEVLLIERAVRAGDPWSGQMAFPGGRRGPEDRDLCSTAVRETLEEVGLHLGAPLGRLDDTESGQGLPSGPLFISAFVFELEERARTTTNDEVQEAVWVPLPELLEPGSATQYNFERPGVSAMFPAIRYERFAIWGLTYRILRGFFAVLDRELPTP